MPLIIYTKDTGDFSRLGIWKITESLSELENRALLSEAEKKQMEAIKLEKRKKEWLATRILLRTLAKGKTLDFLPNGKPILHPNSHISISHSGDLAGMALSSQPVGLDIQGVDEKLLRIEKKFVNSSESSFLPDNAYRVEYLTVIWSVKEAVFKYFGELVDFADHIRVAPFLPDQREIKAYYKGVHGEMTFELVNMYVAGQHVVMTQGQD